MTIHRGQVILLVLAKDNRQGNRPELGEMDVANAVRPALSSGRFPPGESELSQPSCSLDDRGSRRLLEDLLFESSEVLIIETEAFPIAEE